jgi:anti-anti-sigma factor
MSSLAHVSATPGGAVSVASIAGEVDASNVAEIGERLRALLTNRSMTLVVDLTETTYLDSAGINLLFALASELEHRQQRLRLVIASGSQIERLTTMVNLGAVTAIHPTRSDALALDGA